MDNNDNYFIGEDVLGEIVDEIIKNTTLSADSAEELNNIRKTAIKDLDNRIATAVFGRLTDEQAQEYHQLLDRDDATEQDFADFFEKHQIDVQQIMTDEMEAFAKEFIGGQNA